MENALYVLPREARESVGLSLRGMAAAVGISAKSLWMLEQGRTAPRDSTREKIEAALRKRGFVRTVTFPANLF